MGHTNSTANLSLPQFIGTDKPTWLGDINGAFSAIDSYAGTNDAAVAAAASDASSAISQAATAVNTANTANTTAGNASTAANNAVGVANNAVAIAGVVDGKVGLLADLTTTDRTSIVNAINEVNGKDAGDIAYDNSGSGLAATTVQAAIDEVAQGGGGTVHTVFEDTTNTTAISSITAHKSDVLALTNDQLLNSYLIISYPSGAQQKYNCTAAFSGSEVSYMSLQNMRTYQAIVRSTTPSFGFIQAGASTETAATDTISKLGVYYVD